MLGFCNHKDGEATSKFFDTILCSEGSLYVKRKAEPLSIFYLDLGSISSNNVPNFTLKKKKKKKNDYISRSCNNKSTLKTHQICHVHTIYFLDHFCRPPQNRPLPSRNAKYTVEHAHITVVTSAFLKSSVWTQVNKNIEPAFSNSSTLESIMIFKKDVSSGQKCHINVDGRRNQKMFKSAISELL